MSLERIKRFCELYARQMEAPLPDTLVANIARLIARDFPARRPGDDLEVDDAIKGSIRNPALTEEMLAIKGWVCVRMSVSGE